MRAHTYLLIGAVLAVVTAIEVQVPRWLSADHPLLILTLLVLAITKAALVAMYFMHLKSDSRVYTAVILLPLFLAGTFLWLVAY